MLLSQQWMRIWYSNELQSSTAGWSLAAVIFLLLSQAIFRMLCCNLRPWSSSRPYFSVVTHIRRGRWYYNMEKWLHKSKIRDQIRPDSCQSCLTMREPTMKKFNLKRLNYTDLCPLDFQFRLAKIHKRQGVLSGFVRKWAVEGKFSPVESHTRAFGDYHSVKLLRDRAKQDIYISRYLALGSQMDWMRLLNELSCASQPSCCMADETTNTWWSEQSELTFCAMTSHSAVINNGLWGWISNVQFSQRTYCMGDPLEISWTWYLGFSQN